MRMVYMPEVPPEFKNHPAFAGVGVPSKYPVRRVLDEPLPGAPGEAEAALADLKRLWTRPQTDLEMRLDELARSAGAERAREICDNPDDFSEAERYAPLPHGAHDFCRDEALDLSGLDPEVDLGPDCGWAGVRANAARRRRRHIAHGGHRQ